MTALGLALFFGENHGAQAASAMTMISEPGDWVGQGITKTYASNLATFSATGDNKNLFLSIRQGSESWNIDLSPINGELLTRHNYTNAEADSSQYGRSPGLKIYGNGRGCNDIWGSFMIRQISFDVQGKLATLEAIVIQRCGSATAPRLIVSLLYNATPLSFDYESAPGDDIGRGMKKSYFGETTDFEMSGTFQALEFSVYGQHDYWHVGIQAPTGQVLKIGTYSTYRFRDSSHAGVNFRGNGRGCNTSSGVLVVEGIRTNILGFITGLNAVFVQNCDSSSAPAIGTIRFHM